MRAAHLAAYTEATEGHCLCESLRPDRSTNASRLDDPGDSSCVFEWPTDIHEFLVQAKMVWGSSDGSCKYSSLGAVVRYRDRICIAGGNCCGWTGLGLARRENGIAHSGFRGDRVDYCDGGWH